MIFVNHVNSIYTHNLFYYIPKPTFFWLAKPTNFFNFLVVNFFSPLFCSVVLRSKLFNQTSAWFAWRGRALVWKKKRVGKVLNMKERCLCQEGHSTWWGWDLIFFIYTYRYIFPSFLPRHLPLARLLSNPPKKHKTKILYVIPLPKNKYK